MKLVGKPVSEGIVAGRVMIYSPFRPDSKIKHIEQNMLDAAAAAFDEAKNAAEAELSALEAKLEKADPDKAAIMRAHREILLDPAMDEEIRDAIANELLSAESAVAQVFDNYIAVLGKSKNPMMRERASDLSDVKSRLIRCYFKKEDKNLSSLAGPVIVVADDLFPSDTVSLDRANVLGIITQVGGATSHTAIIARSYEIPAVLGVKDAMTLIKDGETAILDAVEGEIFTEPTDGELADYAKRAEKVNEKRAVTKAFLSAEPITKDGERAQIKINIASANDQELAGEPYCDGSGLFRTEFLFLSDDHLPSEDEQFEVYKKVLERFGEKPVVLRTLDIGGDKQLKRLELPVESNPFLGLRGLRLCLERDELFATQLRAALRASAFGNLYIMAPMVGALDEARSFKELIKKTGAELDAKGIAWDRDVKVGIMIEIPSIALIADMAADEVDFVSIGTNDLCQYLCAADRMNASVKPYYQDYHPAMFRTIGYVAEQFGKAGKSVGVCGELGGDPLAIPVLLGLGVTSLSMGLASIAGAKRVVNSMKMSDAKALAREVIGLKTEDEIKAKLIDFQKKIGAM